MTSPSSRPRLEVEPPPIEPYTYGLLSVARVITEDGRWQLDGVRYPTDACAQGGYVSGSFPQPAGDGGTTHDKPVTQGLLWAESGGPFTVYARVDCDAVGFPDPEAVALRRLALIEHREVERAFTLQLASGALRFPLGSTPLPLPMALGALEADAALHYAGQPTIHAPRWTQPYFTTARLVTAQDGVLRTELRSPTAFGAGYLDDPGEPAPPAPAGGRCWLFATGAVTARRGEPFVNQSFRSSSDDRLAIAERTYTLDVDCYSSAVLLQLTPDEGDRR